jgi:hypothetical protein
MTTTWATSKNWKNKNCTHGVLKIPISIAKVVSIEISKLVDRRQLGNSKKNKEIDKLFEILKVHSQLVLGTLVLSPLTPS